MPYVSHDMIPNPIISMQPIRVRTFFKNKCGAADPEAAGAWLISWSVNQILDAEELVQQKFLPDEIETIKDALRRIGTTVTSTPSASRLSAYITTDKMLKQQVGSLSPAEIMSLTIDTIRESAEMDASGGDLYLSALEFGRRMTPPRTKTWVIKLCKWGRLPGTYKDRRDGCWRIPAGDVKIAESYAKNAIPPKGGYYD